MSANDNFSLHDDEELSLHDDASLNGSEPASNKGDAPAKPPQIITTNTLSKHQNYCPMGKSKKRVTKDKDWVYTGYFLQPHRKNRLLMQKERKARTLLLMDLFTRTSRNVFMADGMMPNRSVQPQDKLREKVYDRFQKLLSQLGCPCQVWQDDMQITKYFCGPLPHAWDILAMTMRNEEEYRHTDN
ncbi:hypothetical protein Tco_0525975 [Tanacetum coccineum]